MLRTHRTIYFIALLPLLLTSCATTGRYTEMECPEPHGLEYLWSENPHARVVIDTLTCNPASITGLEFSIGNRSIEDGCLAFIDKNRSLFRMRNPYLELDTVPVMDSYVEFHVEGDSIVRSFEGHCFPTPNISPFPLVDTTEAREMAAYMYEADESMDTLKTMIYLAIWHSRQGRPYLGWAVLLEGLDQENWLYLIDAQSGAYLMRQRTEPFVKW